MVDRLGTKLYRTLKVMLLIACVLFFVFLWQCVSDPKKFPIRHVQVRATYTHIAPGTLRSIILPYTKQSFLRLDKQGLRKSLLQLPWIAEVYISRVWPDRLVIHMLTQQVVARWGNTGLINTQGEIFAPKSSTQTLKNIPIFMGSVNQVPRLLWAFRAFSPRLASLGLRIHSLQFKQHVGLRLVLDNGTQIVIGNRNMQNRFVRFVKAYATIFLRDKPCAKYIDLRYDNGFAVAWKKDTVVVQKTS